MRAKWILGAAVVGALATMAGCSGSETGSVANAGPAKWVTAAGHLATGEEIYWAPTHEDVGTIVGANPHIDAAGDGNFMDGVLIHYKSDGSLEWKDRSFIESGKWLVRTDDAAYGSNRLDTVSIHDSALPDTPILKRAVAVSTIACESRSEFEKIASLLIGNDLAKANDLGKADIASGDCVMLDAGQVVWIEEATKDGRAKVQPEGSQHSYWTTSNAISE